MKTKRVYLAIIGNFIVLILVALYFVVNRETINQISGMQYQFIILAFLLQLLSLAISGLFLQYTVKPLSVNISYKDSLTASTLSSIGNFFMPAGTGATLRAVFLKKKYNLSYSKFISTLSANYVLIFLVNSIIGLLSLLFIRNTTTRQVFITILFVYFTVLILSLALMSKKLARISISTLRRLPKTDKVVSVLEVSAESNRRIYKGRTLLSNILIVILGAIVSSASFYFIAKSFGLHPALYGAVLFSSLSALSTIINLTPGSFGVREVIFSFAASALGAPIAIVILISVTERLLSIINLSIIWFFARHYIPDSHEISRI